MLSLDQCRKYVGNQISDKQLEQFRNALYKFVDPIVDRYLDQTLGFLPEGTTDLQPGLNHVPIDFQ